MNGADMGELHVDVYENSKWTDDIISPIVGNQGNSWKQATVDLSTYTGDVVNIRFRGITGDKEKSDMALDDIELTGTTGLNEDLSLASRINIYPNPSDGIFNIQIQNPESESFKLHVMDMLGRKVYVKQLTELNKTYNDQIEYNTKLNLF